jgi:hypothetical protein
MERLVKTATAGKASAEATGTHPGCSLGSWLKVSLCAQPAWECETSTEENFNDERHTSLR